LLNIFICDILADADCASFFTTRLITPPLPPRADCAAAGARFTVYVYNSDALAICFTVRLMADYAIDRQSRITPAPLRIFPRHISLSAPITPLR